ncbi:selenocysteine-specific elongation factor [Condylostylus longicornis]|uniref:selenocysteine-specific elongation factor n=1 Tax=Condylostylus longicornis TaxID=2530218 RepID=UPI00244DCDEC|nr:selenocysteine-specific elongation factor [Condylostylus longicornis]
MDLDKTINFNLGILGHVDSGKTTLAKLLSTQASTAAFDKHPESQQRGITIDLGFSSMVMDIPEQLKSSASDIGKIQITFVDCPGHASLIRTIIGGAQIIDMMLLVVDAQKGFQTQTSECLVIGELTCEKLFVVINKIDCFEESIRDKSIYKMKLRISKILEKTKFGNNVPICGISALKNLYIEDFLKKLQQHLFIPKRNFSKPFLFYVDHCFAIKGQGTVCTGTIIEGKVSVQQTVEIPNFKEQKKVKSIQMFKKPVQTALQGDRVGICVTQFNPEQMERGILAEPGSVRKLYAGIIKFNKIKYFKYTIKSKSKFHITIGHETVMAKVLLFKRNIETKESYNYFQIDKEYEYVEEAEIDNFPNDIFILLEFENPVLTVSDTLVIGSKLDLDLETNVCRIAFWGRLLWTSNSVNYVDSDLKNLKIYKYKTKQGSIQRIVNENEAIVHGLFKKESKRDIFIGKKIILSTGEEGLIESSFGKSSKVKVTFNNGLNSTTLEKLKSKNSDVLVLLNFKKYIFDKNKSIIQ